MGPVEKKRHRGAGRRCSVNLLHAAVLRRWSRNIHEVEISPQLPTGIGFDLKAPDWLDSPR